MLNYTPDETLAHALDPRSKLALQFAVAIAAFSNPGLLRLFALVAFGLGCLAVAGLALRRVLWSYRFVLAVLALGPLLAAVTLGPPWLRLGPAVESLWSVARVVPVLFVSAAYVHSTPVRETRGAIQRTFPGRVGVLLGVGVGLTFRFLPVIRADVRRVREAIAARGGDHRSLRDRAGRIATLSIGRVLDRADRLSIALSARCFAWNPTLPALSFSRMDYVALAVAIALAVSPFV